MSRSKTNSKTKSSNLKSKIIPTICASIRSPTEPHLQCLMLTKNGEKYCPMHQIMCNLTDYDAAFDDVIPDTIREIPPNITNNLIRKIIVNDSDIKIQSKMKTLTTTTPTPRSTTITEQKVSTIINSTKEAEDNLEINLLILVNDDEYCDRIPKLIGKVYDDVTLSEDEIDPVTMDTIWTMNNGVRVPGDIGRYYLFSYFDSKKKLRCLTIFTMYNLIQDNNLMHPTTTEPIPIADIKRAKRLIAIYQSKIGLFNDDSNNASPEFKLKNRLTKLFKKFHQHSIYLEENWLTNLTDQTNLHKIITETEKLVSNNLSSIHPNLQNFRVFQRRRPAPVKGKLNKTNKTQFDYLEMQEYIVGEWEKLINAANNPNNQIPIWIIALGLSYVVPDVKQKFPDIEVMLS